MSTHNICFCQVIRKILCGYPLLSVTMHHVFMMKYHNNFLDTPYLALLAFIIRRQNDNIFLIFPRKLNLTVHADCLCRRQFAWNVKVFFLGKIRKVFQNVVCWNYYPTCSGLNSSYTLISTQSIVLISTHVVEIDEKLNAVLEIVWMQKTC